MKAQLVATILICAVICTTAYPAGTQTAEIDAEVILPDYMPPSTYTTPTKIAVAAPDPEPIAPIETLRTFLTNDTTEQHEYILSGDDMYICVNFATDLAQNLTDAGYDAGIVVRSAKWHNKGCGHMLTWVEIEGELFVIESGNDWVWISNDYNDTIDEDIYVSRYESLESGYRKCNIMYQRR